ncbi:hypothetical protein IFM61392_04570 [Aspergillus lentulus]|nr:hypothetical protein IFM61392_04570 [Aspergillus lentulus]
MDAEDTTFFCNICGGPPTYKNPIKRSSLQYLDEANQISEHEAFDDYCNCGGQQEQWLGGVRLVAHRIPDAERFTEKDSADLPMVSPLGQHVDPQSGHFFYARPYGEDPWSNILDCNKDGFLVHDACLEIFKLDFLSVVDLGLADRNRGSLDWGYGDSFSEGPMRVGFHGKIPRFATPSTSDGWILQRADC